MGCLVIALAACAPREPTGQTTHAITACPAAEASPLRYLRQLSLDLRGEPPTLAELRAVQAAGRVDDAVLDGLLRDPRFLDRVRRWHAELLWPSLGGFGLNIGGFLAVSPEGAQLSPANINPERLIPLLDGRDEGDVCPPPGDPRHLTAVACCTPEHPDHPACCRARNDAYNPDDPACVARSRALPAVFSYGIGGGDRVLRGGEAYLGCDGALEYPPPRVSPGDARWMPDAEGRPRYRSPRGGALRFYYDAQGVPLPYDDARHCPNYCRATRATGPEGTYLPADFHAKVRVVDGVEQRGDGEGFACPAGTEEVTNPCDNVFRQRPQVNVEIRQEGARLTRPWWARGRWVNTCAYEAMEPEVSPVTQRRCDLGRSLQPGCGCGPEGRWCAPFSGDPAQPSQTIARLLEALNREPLEIIASVVERDEDYATILTTRRGLVNGRLARMYRDQVDRVGEMEISRPAPRDEIPDLDLDEPAWTAYQRGPEHAGVLTTPVFLTRFGSRRGRYNQFRTMFQCAPFVPRAAEPSPPTDPCHQQTNLALRCGCNYCHAQIEPLGAAWGRWGERGANFLDAVNYPARDEACARCVGDLCPARCRFYVTSATPGAATSSIGQLEGYAGRSANDLCRIDEGPRALVRAALADGSLQSCAARTAWERLLNRPMRDAEVQTVLPALAGEFEASGRSYRALIRAVVRAPAYRRLD